MFYMDTPNNIALDTNLDLIPKSYSSVGNFCLMNKPIAIPNVAIKKKIKGGSSTDSTVNKALVCGIVSGSLSMIFEQHKEPMKLLVKGINYADEILKTFKISMNGLDKAAEKIKKIENVIFDNPKIEVLLNFCISILENILDKKFNGKFYIKEKDRKSLTNLLYLLNEIYAYYDANGDLSHGYYSKASVASDYFDRILYNAA